MNPPPILEIDLDELTPEAIREAYVATFGARCAAWLVRRFRRRIRRDGAFAVHLWSGTELPSWCDIALSYLRKKAPRWSVARLSQNGITTWRVTWGGKRRPSPLPESIRRA